jgi:hypothetical protein
MIGPPTILHLNKNSAIISFISLGFTESPAAFASLHRLTQSPDSPSTTRRPPPVLPPSWRCIFSIFQIFFPVPPLPWSRLVHGLVAADFLPAVWPKLPPSQSPTLHIDAHASKAGCATALGKANVTVLIHRPSAEDIYWFCSYLSLKLRHYWKQLVLIDL